MKTRSGSLRADDIREDNAAILSRFSWSTSAGYKKCMVVVFIFLIFLFLLRYPIMKWINHLPDPPIMDVGQCEVKGHGQLNIGHVHVAPASSSGSVTVSFSTNLATNKFIVLQYGTNKKMEYETFAMVSKTDTDGQGKYPYVYYTSFLIVSPGATYYYRVACGSVHSETYEFHSWKSGNGWSPSIALVGGRLEQPTLDTLTEKRHKLSLVAHIDSAGVSHSADYQQNIQSIASAVPFLLVPGGANDKSPDLRFPLPGVEWPIVKDTFHMVIGPVIIVGFNSNKLPSSIPWLRGELHLINKLRVKFPWLVIISQDQAFCIPKNQTSATKPMCEQLFHLLSQYKADLYVSGSSSGYQRSWPIAFDGTALSTYHGAQGFVSLGIKNSEISTGRPVLTPKHVMKNVATVRNTLLELELRTPSSLCMQVESTRNHMTVDHFCIEKSVGISALGPSHTLVGGGYDKTTWLCLVVILSVVIIGTVTFRKLLYSKLCKYMESNGGPPIYRGRLLPV